MWPRQDALLGKPAVAPYKGCKLYSTCANVRLVSAFCPLSPVLQPTASHMSAPQGLVTFPGVQHPISATYTLAHGITPGVCQLTIAPQPQKLQQGGALEFMFDTVKLRFPDCKIDRLDTTRSTQSPKVWILSVLDRRWKWAFGAISGSYNVRLENGELDEDFPRKTPQELARLCLEAMKESGADVSAMPNHGKPEVHWDFANPAQALAELCDAFGCRIVLGLNNKVRLLPVGTGAALPGGKDVADESLAADPPEKPDEIAVYGPPASFQFDLELEAVGLDVDGLVKPINELSYNPDPKYNFGPIGNLVANALGIRTNGQDWVGYAERQEFTSIGSDFSRERELAKATVYRWYRVKDHAAFDIDFVGKAGFVADLSSIGKTIQRWQLLPLGNEQNDTEKGRDGILRPRPAVVYGLWSTDQMYQRNNLIDAMGPEDPNDPTSPIVDEKLRPIAHEITNETDYDKKAICNVPFTINAELGIVEFTSQVYRWLPTDAAHDTRRVDVARLWLRVAQPIRLPDTAKVIRGVVASRTGGKFNTPTRFVLAEEILFRRSVRYASGFTVQSVDKHVSNADLEKRANQIIRVLKDEYAIQGAMTRTYAGLKRIEPDGAIPQVSWQVGPGGAKTVASRNREHSRQMYDYKLRRFYERINRRLNDPNLRASVTAKRAAKKAARIQ